MSRLTGTVTKIVGTSSYVETTAGSYHCDLRARLFRKGGLRLAVGDEVEFRVTVEPQAPDEGPPSPGRGVIEELVPRRSSLRRSRDFKRDQVLCANVDRVFIVVAAFDPPYKRAFIDRLLVGIERDDLSAVLVINKMDLTDDEYRRVVVDDAEVYRSLGYEVLLVSAVSTDGSGKPEGVDALREAFAGRISAVVGPSGVGKSTLLNVVSPGLSLRTGEVSKQQEGRGRHTTTAAELVAVEGTDGFVVDTPGLRAFGLWDVSPQEVTTGFREVAAIAPGCRFNDCAHQAEPSCAVKEAVKAGAIDEERFESYLRLKTEVMAQAAQRDSRRR